MATKRGLLTAAALLGLARSLSAGEVRAPSPARLPDVAAAELPMQGPWAPQPLAATAAGDSVTPSAGEAMATAARAPADAPDTLDTPDASSSPASPEDQRAAADAAFDAIRPAVIIDPTWNSQTQAQLAAALRRTLGSATAREGLGAYAREGGSIVLSPIRVAEDGFIHVGEQKVVPGPKAFAVSQARSVEVFLEPDFLRGCDAEKVLPEILAHEVAGHGLLQLRLAREGLDWIAQHYRGNEARAGLIGWNVSAELGVAGPDDYSGGLMRTYLRSPSAYHRALAAEHPIYAAQVSLAVLREPARLRAALRRRRDFFTRRPEYAQIASHLDALLAEWTSAGHEALLDLAEQARHPQLKRVDREIRRLAARLRRSLGGSADRQPGR